MYGAGDIRTQIMIIIGPDKAKRYNDSPLTCHGLNEILQDGRAQKLSLTKNSEKKPSQSEVGSPSQFLKPLIQLKYKLAIFSLTKKERNQQCRKHI